MWTIFKRGRKPIVILTGIVFILTIFVIFNYSNKPGHTKTTAVGTQKKNTSAKPAYDTRASVALKEYLLVKFGGNGDNGFGVSWYDSITSIAVAGDDPKTVKVTTTLSNNDQGKSDASEIARAIMANGLINIGTVTVSDSSGHLLASKSID